MNLSIQIQWIDRLGFYFDTDFPHYIAHSSTHHSSAFSLPLSIYLPDREAGTHVNLLQLCTYQYEYNGLVFNRDFILMQITTITHQVSTHIVRCPLLQQRTNICFH
uniref:Uncharacterized protein n=1 Tax=Opuntia streptacantha TaxID=393608 RepID=A0A7C9DHP4_OPUST